MRITIVTETYFPQVNGVSRTLGELVRHLNDRGDTVQLIHPDYGEALDGTRTCPCGPFDRPALLQGAVPAAAAVRRRPSGDRAVPARPDPHRHRGDAGPERPPVRAQAPAQRSFRASTPTSTSTADITASAGPAGRSSGTCDGSTTGRERRTSRRGRRSASSSDSGFERLVLWQRGVDATMFRPDRPGRHEIRRALGWSPDDVVIGYVSRIAPGEER